MGEELYSNSFVPGIYTVRVRCTFVHGSKTEAERGSELDTCFFFSPSPLLDGGEFGSGGGRGLFL